MYIYINNKKFIGKKGLTILQTCTRYGFEIPRFCYHEKLTIAGNCRMCLIEISRPKGPLKPKPSASCAIAIADNLFIHTNTILVKKARESVLEFLLINHPLDCPICDQGGECDLQDQTLIYGNDRGRFYETKRAVLDKNLGPIIKTSMNRCIHCTRCVRFGKEIAGIDFLGTTGRGFLTEIAPYISNFLYSEISGNIIDLCPVGALTSKPYSFKARPWELKSVETIDVLDSLCSNIRIDLRGNDIMRILPRTNEDINEDWITDKTRFFYDGLDKQRIHKPLLKKGSDFFNLSWKDIFFWLASKLLVLKKGSNFILNGIVGKNIELESIVALKDMINKLGSSFMWIETCCKLNLDLIYNYIFCRNLKEIEQGDIFFFVSFNPRLELPLLNIRLRKAIKNNNAAIFVYGYTMNLTYKCYNIANNFLTFVSFIEGKSLICRKLLNSRNPFVMQGDSFLYRKDGFFTNNLRSYLNDFFANLKTLFKQKIIFNIIHNTVGVINTGEIGFYTKILTDYNIQTGKCYYYYLINTFEKKLLSFLSRNKSVSFIIYQGHTGNDLAFISDIILPGSNFVEQKTTFINLEQRVQHNKFIKTPPFLARSDWSILSNLSFFIGKYIKYNRITELGYRLLQVTPIIKNIKNKIQNWRLFYINKEKYKIIFYNYPILSSFFNFYDSDAITKVSKTLSMISKKFVKNRNYYTYE